MGSPEGLEEGFGIFSATQILIKPLPVLPVGDRVHTLYSSHRWTFIVLVNIP